MKTIKHLLLIFLFTLIILPESAPAAEAKSQVFVLCYHSFDGNGHFAGDLSMQELSRQLDFLKNKGFGFVSFSDVKKGTVYGRRNILISIDDGYKSVYTAWKKVFKPRRIYPLLSIYPNIIGKSNYALSWRELRELAEYGCEIGAHGLDHASLSEHFYENNMPAFIKEIYVSKTMLEKSLATNVEVFIYPKGVRTKVAKQMIAQAGYRCAFGITWEPVLSPLENNTDAYDLGRYMIYENNWELLSKAILNEVSD